eukprot:gene2960-11048_t
MNADKDRSSGLPDLRLREVAELLDLRNASAAMGDTWHHKTTGQRAAIDGIWLCPLAWRHWGNPETFAVQAHWTITTAEHKVGERLTDHLTVGVVLDSPVRLGSQQRRVRYSHHGTWSDDDVQAIQERALRMRKLEPALTRTGLPFNVFERREQAYGLMVRATAEHFGMRCSTSNAPHPSRWRVDRRNPWGTTSIDMTRCWAAFRNYMDVGGSFELNAVWSSDGKLITGEACADFLTRLLTAKFASPRDIYPEEWNWDQIKARIEDALPLGQDLAPHFT